MWTTPHLNNEHILGQMILETSYSEHLLHKLVKVCLRISIVYNEYTLILKAIARCYVSRFWLQNDFRAKPDFIGLLCQLQGVIFQKAG